MMIGRSPPVLSYPGLKPSSFWACQWTHATNCIKGRHFVILVAGLYIGRPAVSITTLIRALAAASGSGVAPMIEPRLSGQALRALKSCVDSPLAQGVRIQTRASCGNDDCARVAMIAVCKPSYNDLAPLCNGGSESRRHSPRFQLMRWTVRTERQREPPFRAGYLVFCPSTHVLPLAHVTTKSC